MRVGIRRPAYWPRTMTPRMRDDLSLRTRSIGPSWRAVNTAADVNFVSRSVPQDTRTGQAPIGLP